MNIRMRLPSTRFSGAKRIFAVLGSVLAAAVMLTAVSAPIFAQGSGARVTGIYDDAELLSDSQERVLEKLEKRISDKWDINVLIATTTEKTGYSNTDSGSQSYAEDIYHEKTGAHKTEADASGFLILIDMENRYYYTFTHESVYNRVSDSRCEEIYEDVLSYLSAREYYECLDQGLHEMDTSLQDYRTMQLAICWSIRIGGPLLVTGALVLILVYHKRSKITVTDKTYLDAANCEVIGDTDDFTHRTVSVVHHSSGGGGGGGHSGGGGGGHSGGGGGHF
jgi:uncharacterized membrane protein YgcG